MSGFVVVVVVGEENKGEVVSVKLTSVTVVSNVVETDAGTSFSVVVIKSFLFSLAFDLSVFHCCCNQISCC